MMLAAMIVKTCNQSIIYLLIFCFDPALLQIPDSTIEEITNYLRSIHEFEQIYHKEGLKTVRDDKLDGSIDETLFHQKIEDYKKRQVEPRDQLVRHEAADLQFHMTANQVTQLAKHA